MTVLMDPVDGTASLSLTWTCIPKMDVAVVALPISCALLRFVGSSILGSAFLVLPDIGKLSVKFALASFPHTPRVSVCDKFRR